MKKIAYRPNECTCGKCHFGVDAHGNPDYGTVWNGETYVARNCPVAREAVRQNRSVKQLKESGWLR